MWGLARSDTIEGAHWENSLAKAERITVAAAIDAFCEEHGWDRSKTLVYVSGASGCYCDCPDGSCEHQFSGWREFEDGCGGEQVCAKCGMGAMAHSMRTSA